MDGLILAYGEEARRNGLISKDDVDECFTNVLSRAMDGNAQYLLAEADAALLERERSDFEEHNTHHYAASGV